MFPRRRQKLSALIALCAVLFAALLPASAALARATVLADDARVMGVICTTHDATSPSPSGPSVPLAAHEHCALCVLAGSAAVAPGTASSTVLVAAGAAPPPLLAASAPLRENSALHPLVPRGPPRFI
jgi:hypothetical protein